MKSKKILALFFSSIFLLNVSSFEKANAIDPLNAITVFGIVTSAGKTLIGAGQKIFKVFSDCKSAYDYNEETRKYKGFRPKQEVATKIKEISEGKSLLKIYGQEEAKSQCLEALAGCIENIYSEISGDKKPCDKRGNVVYMIGGSGVGKTTMARSIADALLKHPEKTCIFIDSGQINREQPLGEQIFKLTNKVENLEHVKTITGCISDALKGKESIQSTGTYEARVASALLEHLLRWDESVVIIDEFEKMKATCTPPDSCMEYEDKSADEIIKSIAANGYYMVGTRKIDCSKTLFIITTNETREQLNENFGQGGSTGGGIQRLNIIEFNSLSMECCKKIVNDLVETIKSTLTNPKGDYKLKNVVFTEKTLNEMSKFIFNDKTRQARAKFILENKIYSLFLYNMPDVAGKSFTVNYIPSENGVGTFSKTENHPFSIANSQYFYSDKIVKTEPIVRDYSSSTSKCQVVRDFSKIADNN